MKSGALKAENYIKEMRFHSRHGDTGVWMVAWTRTDESQEKGLYVSIQDIFYKSAEYKKDDSTSYNSHQITEYGKLITKLGSLSTIISLPRLSKRAKRKYCSKVSCLPNISSSEHQINNFMNSMKTVVYQFNKLSICSLCLK